MSILINEKELAEKLAYQMLLNIVSDNGTCSVYKGQLYNQEDEFKPEYKELFDKWFFHYLKLIQSLEEK